MRDCENCKHRVMKVEVGKGTPPEHFWGCECWECEFEPTTKNDLGVDCVARQDVERYIEGFINEYTPKEELEFINLELDGLKHIPSVTPQLSVPEVTALAEWTEKLTKASEDAYNKGYADGMNDQELILDKIRAEIEQARYGLVNDGLDIALNIIDKYKANVR